MQLHFANERFVCAVLTVYDFKEIQTVLQSCLHNFNVNSEFGCENKRDYIDVSDFIVSIV